MLAFSIFSFCCQVGLYRRFFSFVITSHVTHCVSVHSSIPPKIPHINTYTCDKILCHFLKTHVDMWMKCVRGCNALWCFKSFLNSLIDQVIGRDTMPQIYSCFFYFLGLGKLDIWIYFCSHCVTNLCFEGSVSLHGAEGCSLNYITYKRFHLIRTN